MFCKHQYSETVVLTIRSQCIKRVLYNLFYITIISCISKAEG
jgi:hypothetical protein